MVNNNPRNMKKSRLYFSISFGIVIIIVSVLVPNIIESKNQRELILYLEKKYDRNFVMIGKIHIPIEEKKIQYAYHIVDDNNIEFVAGKEKESGLLPLFPGFNQFIFFDNYIEQAKIAIIENIPLNQKIYTIETYKDIQTIANNIYNTMTNVNKKLSQYGHDIDAYSCSMDIVLKCNTKEKKQTFGMHDLKYIQQKIWNFYNSP